MVVGYKEPGMEWGPFYTEGEGVAGTQYIWDVERVKKPDRQWQVLESIFANDIIPNQSHFKDKKTLFVHITGKYYVYLEYLDQALK